MFPDFKPSRRGNQSPTIVTEAIQALVSLGYKKREAERVVLDTIEHYGLQDRIDSGDLTVEDLFAMVMSPRTENVSQPPTANEENLLPGGESPAVAAADIVAERVVNDDLAIADPDSVPPAAPTESSPAVTEAPELPEVPKGHERFFYGGTEASKSPRLFNVRGFAQTQAQSVEGGKVYYVDVDENSPHFQKARDESIRESNIGIEFDAPEEIARNLRPVEPPPKPQPVASSEPASAPQPAATPQSQSSSPGSLPVGWFGSDRKAPQPAPKPVEASPKAQQPAPTQSMPVDTERETASQPAAPTESGSMVDTGLDTLQTGLDGLGVADPTPVSDGANAVISLGRAVSDPKNAGTHLMNAGISVVSMIPYVGDLAKGLKYGGKAMRGGRAARGAGKAAARGEASAVESVTAKSPSEQFDEIWDRVSNGGGGPVNNGLGGSGGSGGSGGGGGPASPAGGDDGEPTPGSAEPVADANVRPLTDKITEVAGTFGTVVAASLAYAKTTEQLNKVVLEYHRHISGFNGELAQAYGELETGRMRRDMQNAADYGGSVAGLASSQNDLEEALRDFQSPFTEMGTDIQNGLTQLATLAVQAIDFIEPFSELYPMIKEWLGFKDSDDPAAPGGYFDRLRAKANQFKQKDKV